MSTDKVDAFLEKLAALGGEIIDAAKPALEVATDAALTAVHFNGLFDLVSGVAGLAIAIPSAWACVRCSIYVAKADYDDDLDFLAFLAAMGSGAAALVGIIVALAMLGSADTWMALLRPDAYLAAKALGL